MGLGEHSNEERIVGGTSFSTMANHILILYVIRLNGIYDILCSLAILHILYIPGLRELHLGMLIKREQYSSYEPYFAYWIFTYGIIRLFSTDSQLIAYSYYIEAAVIAFECFVKKTMVVDKSVFVISTSILLGYVCQYISFS